MDIKEKIIDKYRDSLDNLKEYAKLIHEQNQKMNISGYRDEKEIFNEGIIDSIIALDNFVSIKKIKLDSIRMLDIGAGAGFPSVPFLIANKNNFELTIIESQKKRCAFLETIKEKFNLNINILNERIEEHLSPKNHFHVITARALASLKTIYLMSLHLLKMNGYFALLKGKNYRKELYDFSQTFPKKVKCVNVIDFLNTNGEKSVLINIQKTSKTPNGWPLKWKQIINYGK